MKKVVLLVLFLLSVGTSFAQQQRLGVKSVIGAAASRRDNLNLQVTQTTNGVSQTYTVKSVGIQVGLPYRGVTAVTQNNNTSQNYVRDLGFPWGILYRYQTFTEEAFTVSKGYYTDKIAINWQVRANLNLITEFAIYRSTEISSLNPSWGNPIATVSASARSYDDVNAEGGKLYRYKIVARGVESVEAIYSSYINGVGYRNPTGVITGNVSFDSGTPVRNVLISASPTGSDVNFGTSLRIPATTSISVPTLHKVLKDAFTLQAWVKPETNFNNDEIKLYELISNENNNILFKVKLGVINSRNTLTLTLEQPSRGNQIITLSDYIPTGDVDNKGDDVLAPITDVNGSFTHFSAVLRNNQLPEFYINGRLISAAYAAKINTILNKNKTPGTTAPTVAFTTTAVNAYLNTSATGNPQTWSAFDFGGGKTAFLDELRVWETALTAAQIQTDFRRYIKGNESYLHTYLTGNEGTGDFAYDLSSTGFSFHGNNADLTRSSSSNVSTSSAGLIQNGLFVNLEPGQTTSYPGSGSLWTNIGSGGASYNATLQNSPVYNANYGGNFSFNGTNQSTVISRPVQDDFTLSAWFKTTSTSGLLTGAWTGMGIIDGETPGVVNDYGLTMAQGKLMFGVGGGGVGPDVTLYSSNTYNDNRWHHVVCTRVKLTGAMVMYVDGAQVATGTANTNSLTSTTELKIGRSNESRYFQGNISSINIYNNALTATQVQQNYNYFFARHQEPAISSFSTTIPSTTQLGILGVTDQYGNYVISAVPYTGNGNSYTLVPSLGVHEFNPNQQMVYVGVGATVINNVNFKDVSSFTFNGIAVYDSREVFPPTTAAAITGDIKDNEAYNAYVKGNLKYPKGEYWPETINQAGQITSLRRYAAVPVPGATVSIDNQPAIDENNEPIVTDINGAFTIQVPIGQHAISIAKSGHEFVFDGRFPAKTSAVVGGQTVVTNTYEDFYEDRVEPVTFIDNTKVTVIGRVVGGAIQANQVIGFGDTGTRTHNYTDAGGVAQSVNYTSTNNIGQATLTLGHIPAGSNSVTPDYRTTITTNIQTGEFRKQLLPLSYNLSQNDVVFKNNKNPGDRPLLDQDKIYNFTAINSSQTPTFSKGSFTVNGAPYQEILKLTYTATPQFNVESQTSDARIIADGNTYTIASNQETPVYSQFGNYEIRIKGVENYYNHDNSVTNPVLSTVPVTGGEIIATNNLAFEDSERTEISATDPSILIYSFRGGMPNTSAASGYKRDISLSYRLNGTDYPLTGFRNQGILLGGVSDGTQSFVTAGPELPDFVLRDPPGSGSSATIDKGSSFTFTKENSYSRNDASDRFASISLGFSLEVGGSILGPVVKTEITNDINVGVSMAQSSSNGRSVENTYTFNQSISTSDDPNWVGSDADLYIGYSANQIYGTYNKLTATTTQNSAAPIRVVPLANTTANVIYPIVNTALYFNESAEKTFFVYSQRSIIYDLIPKYELFVSQIDSGALIENTNGVLSKNAYLSSINLWKKLILNNELSKFRAYNDRDQLRADLNTILDRLKNPVTNLFSPTAKNLKNLLNATFFENISLDAGVGSITKSYQVDRISSSSLSYELQIDKSIGLAIGAEVNDAGFSVETSLTNGSGEGQSSSEQSSETTNVSYTLSDTDDGNLLSIDVINPFDGNGPIFITKGGETSCPNEAAELSHYYNPTHPNVTAANPTIVKLADADRKPLSVATVPLEVPEITVVSSNNLTGVFEGRNAEFVLNLQNRSVVKKDATFMLVVDQTTNPDNALINIEPNGTLITIPADGTVTYTMTLKKVKADQFDYRNIRVSLQSTCDDNASSSVSVSAAFVKACSSVSVVSPSNNWLMNINTAYNGNITRPLNIKLGDYSTAFTSFKQINLEYRYKGSPNWTGLKTYFKNEADYTAAVTGGDNNVEMIVGNELIYAWDIAALRLPNGTYEIRARSTCYNGYVYESAISEGIVDLIAPVVFGTPTPKNGILGIGDDIAIRFNEPVKLNGAASLFKFEVQKNQPPVSHQVSLAFNGDSNTATINKPYITTGNLSIEFWMKIPIPSGTATLMNQSGGLKVELLGNNVMKYTLGGQSISATILNDGNFNHYTLSYNATTPSLSIIENDRTLTATTSPNPITTLSFTNSNPIVIGGNAFKGNIHDLRLWSTAVTRDQSVANMNIALNGNESGLIGFWPIDEGNGTIANDIARFKDLVILNANWDIQPKGEAYNFDGTKHLATASGTMSRVIISKEMNATVTFWMKTAQTNATILSNGRGDGTDFLEPDQFRNKWAFNTTASGVLELAAEGSSFAFGTRPVNDNAWHHVAMSLTRNGGLSLYIDGNQVGSYNAATIGGFSSTKLFIGARGQANATSDTADRYFVGQLDELCIWNLARTAEQIKADMYFEQNPANTGLLFYSNFNKPEVVNSNGPKYYYPNGSSTLFSDYFLSYVPAPAAAAPSIAQSGLIVNLDPGQTTSYSGSGNVWTNIGSSGATYNATLQNTPTFSTANSGSITFNGTNQFTGITRPVQDDLTISTWFKTTSNAGVLGASHNGLGLVDGSMAGTVADFGLTMAQGKLMFGTGSPDITITSPSTYNDGNWHNVMATRTKATGTISLYVDGILVASGTGSTATLNASSGLNIGRSSAGRYFPGSISAIHFYSNALSATQVQTNFDALKGRFYTQPAPSTPGGTITFTDVSPAIKPFRPTERFVVTPIFNGDEIILQMPITIDWASIEGKVANITVSGLNDMYDNPQASPELWSALISKNPIKMFVEGQGDIVNLVKTTDLPLSFPITIVNQGGKPAKYAFTVPSWLQLSTTSGVLDPNKSTTITATVDMNLAPGAYNNIISLTTNYGIDNKIQLNLRVLVNEPVLNFNPINFTESMNIIAKIKVDGILSNDLYDRIYAVANGANGLEVRGKAALTYNAQLDTYNVFLTVYSNVVSGENISFFIWDASQGNFVEASLNTSVAVPFVSDSVIGNFGTPAICENTNVSGQLVPLQQGWTWVSFNVNDPRFASLNNLTAGADLSTSDLIYSNAPSLFDSYQFYSTGSPNNGWSGTITSNGGVSTNKMYKIKIVKGGELKLKGIPADLNTWSFNLLSGWNWLPYVANKNIPIGDALANLNPADGDLIKSQSLFAIYSSAARAWLGSLTYLNQSQGYMIKVTNAQTLTYPAYINKVNSTLRQANSIGKKGLDIVGRTAKNVGPVTGDADTVTAPLSVDYSKFANTMNAVVKLPEGFNELYFYNDANELRGNCKTTNVAGQELAFITIYGEKSENLTAFIGSNNRNQQTTKTFKFASDVLLGTIAEPIVIELDKQELSIYPNPFHDELKVVVDSKAKGEAKIIIYSITGQTIFDKNFDVNAGTNVLLIQPTVPNGTYLMSVEVDGKVVLNKIIKD